MQAAKITVYELLQRYLSLKCGVRYNTKVGYGFVMNIVQKKKRTIRGKKDPGYQGVGCTALDDQVAKRKERGTAPDQHPGRCKTGFSDGL